MYAPNVGVHRQQLQPLLSYRKQKGKQMIIFRCDSKHYIPKNGTPELNDVPAEFLRQANKEGLPLMKRPTDEERKAIEEQVSRVWALIGDTFLEYPYPVCGLYLFDDIAYSGENAGADGICCSRSNEEAATNFSIIAIGESAVQRGEDYLAFLLLHEITHAATATGKHDEHFHLYLDYLLLSFNQRYGTALKNDYYIGD